MSSFFVGSIYLVLIPLQWETILGSMYILTELLGSQVQSIMLFDLFDFLPALLRYNWHIVNDKCLTCIIS